jgi:hypothetical protein
MGTVDGGPFNLFAESSDFGYQCGQNSYSFLKQQAKLVEHGGSGLRLVVGASAIKIGRAKRGGNPYPVPSISRLRHAHPKAETSPLVG